MKNRTEFNNKHVINIYIQRISMGITGKQFKKRINKRFNIERRKDLKVDNQGPCNVSKYSQKWHTKAERRANSYRNKIGLPIVYLPSFKFLGWE